MSPLITPKVLQKFKQVNLDELLKRGETLTVPVGAVLFKEGDLGDALYIVQSGVVSILTATEDGSEILLNNLSTGDYFGEQFLLSSDNRRNATAVAAEFCELLRIDGGYFKEILQENQDLANYLSEVGASQLRNHLLRQHEIFKPLLNLPEDQQTGWFKPTPEEYSDGTVIFREGEVADRLFLIAGGFVKISREENGVSIPLVRLGKGSYFGELALINHAPRSATATADGHLKLISLKGDTFLSLFHQEPLLREYMECVKSFYVNLPLGRLMTLHRGKFMGKNSITALHHLDNGLVLSSSRVVGEPIFTVACQQNAGDVTTVAWRHPDFPEISRELLISRNRLVGVMAVGMWPDLGRSYHLIALQKKLHCWQLALFRREGTLWLTRTGASFDDEQIVCRCTGVIRRTLLLAVADGCNTLEALGERTGAAQICGSCAPALAEIVGNTDLEWAELLATIPVTVEIKSFRFRPRQGKIVRHKPGQHIRLEAQIGGRWVQRAYTLTSPVMQEEYYEITVKRELKGLMSRWLHDNLNQQSAVRISTPQGCFTVETDQSNPVICFCGGIGVTPALALLRNFPLLGGDRLLHIEYSVSEPGEIIYPEEFKQAAGTAGIRVNIRISREQGRLKQLDVAQIAAGYPNADYLICGAAPYEQAVRKYLSLAGIEKNRIRVEHFIPHAAIAKPKGAKALLGGCGLALLICLLLLILEPISPPSSIAGQKPFSLPSEFFWRQTTGYTILGLGCIGLFMSLRKRIAAFNFGHYAWWRVLHVATGLLALAVLAVHTNLHMGVHLNRFLMVFFLLALISGALSGGATVLENHRPNPAIHRFRLLTQDLHLFLLWPLPALLGLHIISAYFF